MNTQTSDVDSDFTDFNISGDEVESSDIDIAVRDLINPEILANKVSQYEYLKRSSNVSCFYLSNFKHHIG